MNAVTLGIADWAGHARNWIDATKCAGEPTSRVFDV